MPGPVSHDSVVKNVVQNFHVTAVLHYCNVLCQVLCSDLFFSSLRVQSVTCQWVWMTGWSMKALCHQPRSPTTLCPVLDHPFGSFFYFCTAFLFLLVLCWSSLMRLIGLGGWHRYSLSPIHSVTFLIWLHRQFYCFLVSYFCDSGFDH